VREILRAELRPEVVGKQMRLAETFEGKSVNTETVTTVDRTEAALLDVQAVATLLSCSTRHVYRLADAGRMPPRLKLGALVRWNKNSVLTWLAEGCPPCRKGGR
jgi:excisionase family DNA binding protein